MRSSLGKLGDPLMPTPTISPSKQGLSLVIPAGYFGFGLRTAALLSNNSEYSVAVNADLRDLEMISFGYHTLFEDNHNFEDEEIDELVTAKPFPSDVSTVALGSYCRPCGSTSDTVMYEVVARLAYFSGPKSMGIYNGILEGMEASFEPLGSKVQGLLLRCTAKQPTTWTGFALGSHSPSTITLPVSVQMTTCKVHADRATFHRSLASRVAGDSAAFSIAAEFCKDTGEVLNSFVYLSTFATFASTGTKQFSLPLSSRIDNHVSDLNLPVPLTAR